MMSAPATLEVLNLKTHFFTKDGVVKAVDGVSFAVNQGEVLGLVGESGSGKTVTGFSVLGLVEPPGRIVGGKVLFQGNDVVALSDEKRRQLRGSKIAMIFQDPMMTLNPVLRIDTQMIEAIQAHDPVRPHDRPPARPRCAGKGGHVFGGPAAQGLSAPVLGRHAPASGHRHRASEQAGSHHCRRTDHGAGRHHPGADSPRGPEALPRDRHRAHLDHPRS